MTLSATFSLNGVRQDGIFRPDMRLADILRDRFALAAARTACGIGRCGACMVLMNGLPVNACLVMAWQIDGADIISPEGLDALPEAKRVRQALAAESAFQCGYCAPGFTIALTALLRQNPMATEADIRAALEGNICRCTGYHSIIRGALHAAALLQAETRAAGPEENIR